MIIFRRKGKIVRSKMAFLQSKKLYSDSVKGPASDPFNRMGMGRLLETEEEHLESVRAKTIRFEETSKYKAFKKESDQQLAMSYFQQRFEINMYYLFYNPVRIPYTISSPLEGEPELGENIVGCRVITKNFLDEALDQYNKNYIPSYGDLKYLLSGTFINNEHTGGWRLEYFVVDQMMACKEGFIDDSPNFRTVHELLNQKTSPISAALSITIDLEG